MSRSPLLDQPGAVGRVAPPAETGSGETTAAPAAVDGPDADPDAAVPAHFGDPFAEQRALSRRAGVVDRSHRGVIVVSGADRLSWLHLLLSQQLADLEPGGGTEGLVLDAAGRVEHHAVVSHLAGGTDEPGAPARDAVWLDVEPGTATALTTYLDSMRFWSDVAPRDATEEYAVLSVVGPDVVDVLTAAGVPTPSGDHASEPVPGGGVVRRMPWPGPGPEAAADVIVPRAELVSWWERLRGAGAAAVGLDAFEALRVAALRPRLGRDTDDRTIPHEVGWIGSAVHLTKGCYRGQETVSRVSNLGRPPRQMVLLHLASGDDALPPPGTPVLAGEGGRAVGRIGTAVRHHELGAVALALVKRSAVAPAVPAAPSGDAPAADADGPTAEPGSGERASLWVADEQSPGPAAIDPDSVPPDTGEPPGRAAMRRLRG